MTYLSVHVIDSLADDNKSTFLCELTSSRYQSSLRLFVNSNSRQVCHINYINCNLSICVVMCG